MRNAGEFRERRVEIRKGVWILAGLVVFALNWAALHDIIKGQEPDLRAEYTVVVLTAIGLVFCATTRILRARKGGTGHP